MTKRLKSTKVNGVRVCLQAYQTRPINREGNPQEVTVFYYIVKVSDGSRRKIMQYEEALLKYQQLIAFKKRQLELPKVIEPRGTQTAFVLPKEEGGVK